MNLLVLHGFLGDGADWGPFLEALNERRPGLRAAAPTLPGHGLPPAAPPEAFAGWVDWTVERLLEQPAPCHLLGYSLGGRLALAAALDGRTTGRVASLCLLSASPGLAGEAERAARRRVDAERAESLRADGLKAFLRRWYAQPLFAPLAEAAGVEALARRRASGDAGALARSIEALSPGRMPDFRPRLGELELPVLALAGELDARYAADAGRLAEALPQGRCRLLPSAGHALLLEAPRAAAAAWAEFEADITVKTGEDR